MSFSRSITLAVAQGSDMNLGAAIGSSLLCYWPQPPPGKVHFWPSLFFLPHHLTPPPTTFFSLQSPADWQSSHQNHATITIIDNLCVVPPPYPISSTPLRHHHWAAMHIHRYALLFHNEITFLHEYLTCTKSWFHCVKKDALKLI